LEEVEELQKKDFEKFNEEWDKFMIDYE